MSQKITNLVVGILKKSKASSFPISLEKILKHYNIGIKFSVFEDSVSGLLYKKDNDHLITVNSLHPIVRQRFTIAHELGHFFLNHHSNLFIDKGNLYRDTRSREGNIKWEKEANKFAAELLMPEKMIIEFIEKEKIEDVEDLTYIAEKLGVSREALTYRLANLDLISFY